MIILKQNIEGCRKIQLNSPFNKPLQPLFKKVEIELTQFEQSVVKDGLQAAKWCLNHHLVQQGYTILQETLIIYFVSMIGEDPENFYDRNKIIANQAVTIFFKKIPEQEWFKESALNKDITKKFQNLYKNNQSLIKIYRDLTGSKNDINDCGIKDNPATIQIQEEKLGELINNVEKILKFKQ